MEKGALCQSGGAQVCKIWQCMHVRCAHAHTNLARFRAKIVPSLHRRLQLDWKREGTREEEGGMGEVFSHLDVRGYCRTCPQL